MNNNILNTVRNKLFSLQDEKYRSFHSKLCPGVNDIIGVRTPAIRKLVKELLKDDYIKYIEIGNKDYYKEIMIEGLLIAESKLSFIEKEKYLDKFIPKINCWAITDICAASFKLKKEELNCLWNYLQKYKKSDQEYCIRFMIVMWMDHFLTDDYIKHVLLEIDKIKSDAYYVNMAIAWLISVSYIKYPTITKDYLLNNNLDKWTYNKALQKIIESNRVSIEEKDKVRKMKLN